jgi:membrane protein DedA with SNARE-associated domain
VSGQLIPGLLHLHHQFHGPPIDYAGLAAAAAASWIGVPGPGEPVLIAAGIFAAKHKLDITSVLIVAWVAAVAGGTAGWAIGLKAGRALVTGPGPLRGLRKRAVARGEEVFARWPVIAIVFTPTWIAGIHGVRPALFLAVNAISAAIWAAGIGLGAYLVGPAVVDFADDLGLVAGIVLIGLVLVGVSTELTRRRRRARDAESTAADH